MSASADPYPSQTLGVTLNEAVHNCVEAYNKILEAERAAGSNDFRAREKAAEAYHNAMPYLTAHGNIRGFIACVGHGMSLKIIRFDEGSKLLYAAQVALAALPRELRAVGRPAGNPARIHFT